MGQSRPREKREKIESILVKQEPLELTAGATTTGKPMALTTPVVKLEPSLTQKTGKPAFFEKMMSDKNSIASKPIMFPSNRPPTSSSTNTHTKQMDPAVIQSSILSRRNDLTVDEQQNMKRLIDSLFSEDMPVSAAPKPQPAPPQPSQCQTAPLKTSGTFVLASSSAGGVVPKPTPPPLTPASTSTNSSLPNQPQQPLPRLLHMPQPPPNTQHTRLQQRPLPDSKHHFTATPSTTTNSTTPPQPAPPSRQHSTPILNSLLKKEMPQHDGNNDSDRGGANSSSGEEKE